nr:hypothetical protein GCM10025732_07160 [Glycomyces mayteni]
MLSHSHSRPSVGSTAAEISAGIRCSVGVSMTPRIKSTEMRIVRRVAGSNTATGPSGIVAHGTRLAQRMMMSPSRNPAGSSDSQCCPRNTCEENTITGGAIRSASRAHRGRMPPTSITISPNSRIEFTACPEGNAVASGMPPPPSGWYVNSSGPSGETSWSANGCCDRGRPSRCFMPRMLASVMNDSTYISSGRIDRDRRAHQIAMSSVTVATVRACPNSAPAFARSRSHSTSFASTAHSRTSQSRRTSHDGYDTKNARPRNARNMRRSGHQLFGRFP